MKRLISILSALLVLLSANAVSDSLMFKGQLSALANYNPNNTLDLNANARFIPQLNYELSFDNKALLDFELSANAFGIYGTNFDGLSDDDGDVKPYRAWARYSTEQLELRVGLQKLNFGQAMMLRPLMWFDSMDPRDPLGITDGVYGGLVRYYFLDNTNVWLWGLYGNNDQKGLEALATKDKTTEFGGRIQSQLLKGELALTYHNRKPDDVFNGAIMIEDIQENRLAFDARWDFVIGAYLEGAWINNSQNIGLLTNQEFLTLGIDYTFGLGTGIYTVVEHMMVGMGQAAFDFNTRAHLTALQMSYSIGMFDNVAAIFYADWANEDVYSFVNWSRQYDKLACHLIAYWNPEGTLLPMPGLDGTENLMSGRGLQVMLVYNF